VVCISLVCLQFWTHHVIRNLSLLTYFFGLVRHHLFELNYHEHISMQSVGYEFVLNHCVFLGLLDNLLINNLGLQDIFTYIYIYIYRIYIRRSFWVFHWVTGPLVSLSIECSRQKVRISIWLIVWLVWLHNLFDLSN